MRLGLARRETCARAAQPRGGAEGSTGRAESPEVPARHAPVPTEGTTRHPARRRSKRLSPPTAPHHATRPASPAGASTLAPASAGRGTRAARERLEPPPVARPGTGGPVRRQGERRKSNEGPLGEERRRIERRRHAEADEALRARGLVVLRDTPSRPEETVSCLLCSHLFSVPEFDTRVCQRENWIP